MMQTARALAVPAILALAGVEAHAELREYEVVPESSWLEYEADSLFGGVVGRTYGLTGTVSADPNMVFGTVSLQISVPTASFDSGWEWRDEDVREMIGSSEYPALTLGRPTMVRWTPFPTLTNPTGADGEAVVWVQWRDVQAQENVLFRFDQSPESGRILLRGEAESDMRRYRIKPPTAYLYTSDPELAIRFELVLKPKTTAEIERLAAPDH